MLENMTIVRNRPGFSSGLCPKSRPEDKFFISVYNNKSKRKPIIVFTPGGALARRMGWRIGDPVDIFFGEDRYWIGRGSSESTHKWCATGTNKDLLTARVTLSRPMPFWNAYSSLPIRSVHFEEADGGLLLLLDED